MHINPRSTQIGYLFQLFGTNIHTICIQVLFCLIVCKLPVFWSAIGLGNRCCVLGTRACKQRTGVFWPGVPTLAPVVRRTSIGPQAGVCAPFLFAQKGFGVSFPGFLLYKRPINEILLESFRKDVILMAQQGAVKGIEGVAGCVGP